MGVPNTTTFTLQDVVTEVNPTTDDLNDCFSDADASYFNSAYEGSKNQLLNFRDYGSQNALTSFLSNTSSPRNPCTITSSNTTFYHNGSGTFPAVGDIVYSDSAGTTPLFGGGRRQFNSNGSGSGQFTIEIPITGPDTGEVTSIGICF